MITLDKVYRHTERLVPRKVVDEVILVPIRNRVAEVENIFSLNEVGARVYELVDGQRSGRDICDLLLEEFETTRETMEADVLRFLEQLASLGGIEEVGSRT